MRKAEKNYRIEESSLYKNTVKMHRKLWIPYTVALTLAVVYILIKGVS